MHVQSFKSSNMYVTGSEKTNNFEFFSKMSYCYQHNRVAQELQFAISSEATNEL